MISYSPITGDPLVTPIQYRARSCFIMTKLGKEIPEDITIITDKVKKILQRYNIQAIDASTEITGRDFLDKIWKMILSVPFGIGIVSESLSTQTVANIFYEVGLLHAYGKEVLIIKTEKVNVPSDFVRTEYLQFSKEFDDKFEKYIEYVLGIAESYELYADQLDKNPLLAIDYLKRAYLISANEKYRNKAQNILSSLQGLETRAKNSVELLMSRF